MRHLILTRLAVGNPNEEWLRIRIKIFEDFCAPSVASQTCKNFTWLLAVNHDTSKWFIDRIVEVVPFATLVYSDSQNIYPNWQYLIPKKFDAPILLTTRLDSDDSIHQNFVEEVQKVAKYQKKSCALDAPLGYKLNQLTSECFEVQCPSNHFISVLEFGTSQTAFCCNHLTMNTKFPIVTYCENKPLWVEVFHGNNVLNKAPKNGGIIDWAAFKPAF